MFLMNAFLNQKITAFTISWITDGFNWPAGQTTCHADKTNTFLYSWND